MAEPRMRSSDWTLPMLMTWDDRKKFFATEKENRIHVSYTHRVSCAHLPLTGIRNTHIGKTPS